ncbi:unnamed protein product [Macrosiphum euphorbiae]|uniref:Transposable element P transposase n=1 Tax=Macrosiphum euphorbiae TaxID=13131 RepID=A0AAV0XRY0_9HEMI|nr:unnamed protein product [Macrosiphum euphorbiae]
MAGYNAEYNAQLKIMAKTMSVQEKKCVILIDEMSLKSCLEYNESLDMIEGYEDFGNLRRSGKSAKLVLVVMIRGLCNNWKLPLSYYFSSTGVKGNQLAEIMKQTVETIVKLGFSPVCITCDQGTANRKMYTLLGGSSENPFTVIGGRQLFLIYDVPHLVKSVRNNLLTGNIVINKNGQKKIIDFEDFRNTYKIDKTSKTARALCKIDERHLYPNAWQKMNCKLAIQVFSHTVSAAIKTCVGTNQLISPTALDTADFFLEMNNLFDALNSKNLYDKNPNRRPMSENNDNIIKILRNSLETFKNAEKKNKKTSSQETNNNPPCFIGFVWTINAVLQLYESEKNEMGQFFLITNRLCQDALENLFSIFRQKCGYNKNPTCRTFRCGFSSICSFSLLNCTSEKSNCEEDNDTFLTPNILSNTPSPSVELEFLDTVDENKSTEVDLVKEIEVDEDSEIYDLDLEYERNNEGGSLEEFAVIYYAGYLAMKCLKKFDCEKCHTTLLHPDKMLNDKNQLLLVHKTYNVNFDIDKGLKVPSKQLELFTKICLDTFKTKFPIVKSHSNLLSKLIDFATTNITRCSNINIQDECSTHYKYIMKLLFVVRIHKECKWTRNNNRTSIYNGTNKPNAKLRNIQNL